MYFTDQWENSLSTCENTLFLNYKFYSTNYSLDQNLAQFTDPITHYYKAKAISQSGLQNTNKSM